MFRYYDRSVGQIIEQYCKVVKKEKEHNYLRTELLEHYRKIADTFETHVPVTMNTESEGL